MDFSKLSRIELLGAFASVLLVFSVVVLTWYDLAPTEQREAGEAFICGVGNFSCTGFQTFPILRWLLIAGAAAPVILAYIIARGHELSWPPGEMTMVVGFTAFVLIAYNGIIEKPGSGVEQIGVSLRPGYWVALLAAGGIAAAGIGRAMEGQQQTRKAPGTV